MGIPGASHLSPNSDVYLRRNCTSQSWIKPFVVLGIFSAKARDPFIIHPCFFMFVQYDFNDPLRGPWRFASIHGCFNTIWIDWYFAFYHPVLFPCIPKAGPWVLQWDRRYGWPPTTNCCSLVPKRGGIDVSTHISYIYIYVYVYIYLSIVYIITSSPQKRRAALPTTIIWLLKLISGQEPIIQAWSSSFRRRTTMACWDWELH